MSASQPAAGHPPSGRPDPAESRAVLPRSRAGRLWAAAALVVGPALLLAATEAPARLFADRLPTDSVDRWGIERTPIADDHAAAVWLLAWTGVVWLTFLVVRFVPAERVRRRGLWAGLVPLLYVFAGSTAGVQIAQVVVNLDAERYTLVRGAVPTGVHYGVTVVSLAVGALLARQVIRHLPRPAAGRTRTAWVGSVPLGVPTVLGYVIIAAFWGFLGGWVQQGEFLPGVMLAALMLALWHWSVGSTDVVIGPTGVQVTSGALRPLRYTKTLPLAEISEVEVVRVSAGRALWSTLSTSGRGPRCAFRTGPALRLHRDHPSKAPWLLGMGSVKEAEQAAEAIRSWRPTKVAA